MHGDQDMRLFIFFLLYPFGGIFTHLKMKKNRQNQNFPLIYLHTRLNMRVPKSVKEILLLWYALMYSADVAHCCTILDKRYPFCAWFPKNFLLLLPNKMKKKYFCRTNGWIDHKPCSTYIWVSPSKDPGGPFCARAPWKEPLFYRPTKMKLVKKIQIGKALL